MLEILLFIQINLSQAIIKEREIPQNLIVVQKAAAIKEEKNTHVIESKINFFNKERKNKIIHYVKVQNKSFLNKKHQYRCRSPA